MNVRHCRRPALVAAGLAFACAAQADTHLSPGLWEQQVTMKSDNAQMEASMAKMKEQMAGLSPEQRAMVEKMMASKGVSMGASGNTFRVCMTKEQVERDAMPQRDGQCSQQELTRSGSTMKYRFTCQGGHDGPVSGSGEFTLNGSTGYTGHTLTTMTVQGKPTQVQSDVVGKWLGSDCGDIKPLQVPAR
jgi:hypothetical protein